MTLGDLDHAKDFMTHYFPNEILQSIDLTTITTQKNSFIEPHLTESFSNLVFKVKINRMDGYLYFLFEHKSYSDGWVALQLLKYMLKIWDQKVHQEKYKKLPIIIPFVFFHQLSSWTMGRKLSDKIKHDDQIPKSIIAYIPNFKYVLLDVSRYKDEELKGNLILQMYLKLMRAIQSQPEKPFKH